MKNSPFSIVVSLEAQAKLRTLGVTAVYLFGSYAEGVARSSSDIDFAVLMGRGAPVSRAISAARLYENLYELLSPLAPEGVRDIDVVVLQRAPLELQRNVVQYGKVLCQDDPEERLDYEARVRMLSADFSPLLREFDVAILQRV